VGDDGLVVVRGCDACDACVARGVRGVRRARRRGVLARRCDAAASSVHICHPPPRCNPTFPSWKRSIVAEIDLCHACSDHEIIEGGLLDLVVPRRLPGCVLPAGMQCCRPRR
jgi:hypothetical protein